MKGLNKLGLNYIYIDWAKVGMPWDPQGGGKI